MTQFRKTTCIKAGLAGLTLSVSLLAAPALAQQQPQPTPRIVVMEQDRIMRDSKVGKEIRRQLEALGKAAENEFKGREASLKTEQTKLAQQAAILSASAKAQKEKEFRGKVEALQKAAQNRQMLIQGGLYKAQTAVRKSVGDIVQAVMKARGASLMMEKTMFIAIAPGNFDVTGDIIAQLDKVLPTIKVELTPLPPDVLAAAQRQAQMQAAQQQR